MHSQAMMTQARPEQLDTEPRQICVKCGHAVWWGSGRYVNRVPVLDSLAVKAQTYSFPQGGYVCGVCDEQSCSDPNC